MQTFSTPCIRNTHQPEWEIPDGGSGVVPTPTFKSLQCLLSHGRLHRKWNQSAVQPARQPTLVQNGGDGSLDLLRDNMAEVMRPEVNETATAKGSSGFVQKNPFKIHKPSQYGMEKQHKGAKLFRNIYVADGQHTVSVKTDWGCILPDFAQQIYFLLNNCSVLGSAVSDW